MFLLLLLLLLLFVAVPAVVVLVVVVGAVVLVVVVGGCFCCFLVAGNLSCVGIAILRHTVPRTKALARQSVAFLAQVRLERNGRYGLGVHDGYGFRVWGRRERHFLQVATSAPPTTLTRITITTTTTTATATAAASTSTTSTKGILVHLSLIHI